MEALEHATTPPLLMAPGVLGRVYSPLIEGSRAPRATFAVLAATIAAVTFAFLP